jgi:hypothetical protein
MGVLRAWQSGSTVATLSILMSASTALASQGPGGGPGTASALTQSVMAAAVYGSVAVVTAAGLVQMLRRRLQSIIGSD